MCDWFAVSKTFSKIEEQRDDLADEIGNFISEEIIGSEKRIKNLIDEKLADPVLHKEVSEYLGAGLAADAICDRLLRPSLKIKLSGDTNRPDGKTLT